MHFQQLLKKNVYRVYIRALWLPWYVAHSVLISSQLGLLQLGCAILNGIVFGTYGFFMKAQLQNEQHEPSLSQVFIAGAGSGVASS